MHSHMPAKLQVKTPAKYQLLTITFPANITFIIVQQEHCNRFTKSKKFCECSRQEPTKHNVF